MNKYLKRFIAFQLCLFALCCIGAFATTAFTDTRTESILPQFARMRSSQNVHVVNLKPFRVARTISGSDQQGLWLSYGEKCFMREGETLVAIGQDGDRVLVRSRQADPGYLPFGERGAAPYCTEEALFWMHIQQFRMAAVEYREAEAKRVREETAEERDKRVIRKLLDEQLARK